MALSSTTIVDVFFEGGGSKKEMERRLAEYALGIACALEAAEVTIGQAEYDLFNLDVYNAAKKNRLSKTFIEMLEWGMELEDVAELSPRSLHESIVKIRQLAREVISKS
jgi:hypothetical protein